MGDSTKFVTKYRSEGDPRAAAAVVKLCLLADLLAAVTSAILLFACAEFLARWFIKDESAVGALRLCALMPIVLIPSGHRASSAPDGRSILVALVGTPH